MPAVDADRGASYAPAPPGEPCHGLQRAFCLSQGDCVPSTIPPHVRPFCSAGAASVVAAWCALTGCHAVLEPPVSGGVEQLLKPPAASPDTVTLEIFQVRIMPEQAAQAAQLWNQVDEQCLSTEARRRLVANGFRAGVAGAPLPDELSQLLGLGSGAAATAEGDPAEKDRLITDKTAAPPVRRRLVQLDRREHVAIQTSEVVEELRVLLSREGRLHGQTFLQTQAVYAMRAEATAGQRAAVSLVPELHHGELRNRYRGSDQGIFLMSPSREREVFDELLLQAELSPGELLVLGCVPDAGASLGYAFHRADEAAAGEQKLVLVRLLQVPQSEILAAR